MKYYIANFGVENFLWKECLEDSVVATFEIEPMRPLWEANDRTGYIQLAMATQKTAAGLIPTEQVASRWFNLATTVSETNGDVWIHRDGDNLWWTVSKPEPPIADLRPARYRGAKPGENIWVIRKPAEKWRNTDKKGRRLSWKALHPKAHDFLFTQGTLQSLGKDNSAYTAALIEGSDLSFWQNLPDWKQKSMSKGWSEGIMADARRRSAATMAYSALGTAATSNGQQVTTTRKIKNTSFQSQNLLEEYILQLLDMQEGRCALSGLKLHYHGEDDEVELRCSLDRIDSNGHYDAGNLQVVCWFINRWKSDTPNNEFKYLLEMVRNNP